MGFKCELLSSSIEKDYSKSVQIHISFSKKWKFQYAFNENGQIHSAVNDQC